MNYKIEQKLDESSYKIEQENLITLSGRLGIESETAAQESE